MFLFVVSQGSQYGGFDVHVMSALRQWKQTLEAMDVGFRERSGAASNARESGGAQRRMSLQRSMVNPSVSKKRVQMGWVTGWCRVV